MSRQARNRTRTGARRRSRRALLVVLPAVVALLGGCTTPGAESGAGRAAAPPAPSGTPLPAADPTPEGTLLVADFGADTVTFVDPERGPVGSVTVGTAPYGLAVGPDGLAWVATAEGVAVVDTRTRTRVGLIPYTTGTGPAGTGEYRGGGMGIVLSPDGSRVYVGVNAPGRRGVLEVIDTAARRVTATVPVGRRPFDVDLARDGREVYVTGHDSFDVTVVPADTLAPRRIEVAPYGTEGGLASWLKPHYAVVRPGDGRLLLPFEGARLAVVDPRSGTVAVEPMTADTHQHGVTLTADGRLLVVGTGAVEKGKGPSLTVRSPGGEERVYPLDGPHEDVAVSRDGRTAYVTGGYTREGYWNGLTVVDLADGSSRRLPAGSRPLGIAVL